MSVVPAIIPTSAGHLKEALAPLRGVASEVQVDLVDATFGSPSWPFKEGSFDELGSVLRELVSSFEVEMDLMVTGPEDIIPELIAAGVKRLVLHPKDGVWPSTTAYRDAVKVGVAFYSVMEPNMFERVAPSVDFVQCMGIEKVGMQGASFDSRILEDIETIHTTFPDLQISVDGHVSVYTLPLLKHAGATRFVAGSAILGAADSVVAYYELEKIANA